MSPVQHRERGARAGFVAVECERELGELADEPQRIVQAQEPVAALARFQGAPLREEGLGDCVEGKSVLRPGEAVPFVVEQHIRDRNLPLVHCFDDLVRLGPDGYPAFRAVEVDPPRALVLLSVDPQTGAAPATPVVDDAGPVTTWSWRLRSRGRRCSRLVTRQRTTFPSDQSVLWHVVEPIDFVMERKMLRGIKERAERAQRRA